MSKKNRIFIFPFILTLTVFASAVSLLKSDFYFRDSAIIAVKSHYLDMINLYFVVPLGILMFILSWKRTYWAKTFILGIMAYLAFMFGFNALSLFFNELFLVYIALFSLNVFGIISGYSEVQRSGNLLEKSLKIKLSAIFLLLFSVTAYAAWLIEVYSSTIHGSIPESIVSMNLPVSVVHVFDMGFALPIIVYGALKLINGKMSGLIISSIMAAFVFLICISVLGMELALKYEGLPIDGGKLISFYVLTPLSIFPMITLLKEISKTLKVKDSNT